MSASIPELSTVPPPVLLSWPGGNGTNIAITLTRDALPIRCQIWLPRLETAFFHSQHIISAACQLRRQILCVLHFLRTRELCLLQLRRGSLSEERVAKHVALDPRSPLAVLLKLGVLAMCRLSE